MANASSSRALDSVAGTSSLCPRCERVLDFDDSMGVVRIREDGTRSLDFMADDGGWAKSWPRRFVDHHRRVDSHVEDSLPGLPRLEQSAARYGCSFCSLLRNTILKKDHKYQGELMIELYWVWEAASLRNTGLCALIAGLTSRSPKETRDPDLERNLRWDYFIFIVESDDAQVNAWLRLARRRGETAMCEKTTTFMRESLRRCVSKHKGTCNIPRSGDPLPRRLLDIGCDEEKFDWRLIETETLARQDRSVAQQINYAALSYCWGPKEDNQPQLRTTSLRDMKLHISQSPMAQTLRDAIKVCQALGIRYLWADVLCIIQDDRSDWERESKVMGLVYKNAVVTICALSSNSAGESFLHRDAEYASANFRSRLVPNIQGTFQLVPQPHQGSWVGIYDPMKADQNPFQYHWMRRGWTFQESELSPRKLLFGRSMVHFQCNWCWPENHRTENIEEERAQERTFISQLLGTGACQPSQAYDAWRSALGDGHYGVKKFTYDTDKLPALSGMAMMVADMTRDEYLAGLWEADLHRGLLWESTPWAARRKEFHELLSDLSSPSEAYAAPSWSPLRTRQPFLYPSVQKKRYKKEVSLIRKNIVGCDDLKVNPFGRVAFGTSIHVEARLARVKDTGFALEPSKKFDGRGLLRSRQESEWSLMDPQREGDELQYGLFRLDLDWELKLDPTPSASDSDLSLLLVVSSEQPPENRRTERQRAVWMTEEVGYEGIVLYPVQQDQHERATASRSSGDASCAPDASTQPVLNRYVRVGTWSSSLHHGLGSKYFENYPRVQVEII